MRFVDGSAVEADVVVYCTGYKITFPFFDEDSSPRRTTTSSCSGASSTPISRTCSSSACCSRSARSCRWPRRRARGSATTCWATMRCLRRPSMRARHRRRSGGDAQALRGLQAPHDPGRLRRLPARAGEGAPRGRRAARAANGYIATGAMPTFCRHNRFLERCPICSKTRARSRAGGRRVGARQSSARAGTSGGSARRRSARGTGVRIHREGRAEDDGYRCELVPGLRASADASRLAEEIAFASGRLLALAAQPPGLYGEARALAATELERATWICLLIVYLSPARGRRPLRRHPSRRCARAGAGYVGDGDCERSPRPRRHSPRSAYQP